MSHVHTFIRYTYGNVTCVGNAESASVVSYLVPLPAESRIRLGELLLSVVAVVVVGYIFHGWFRGIMVHNSPSGIPATAMQPMPTNTTPLSTNTGRSIAMMNLHTTSKQTHTRYLHS